jgi:glutamate 5-kinase
LAFLCSLEASSSKRSKYRNSSSCFDALLTVSIVRVINEKAEMEAKQLKEYDGAGKPKELPAHQMPSAPRFN